MFNSKEFGQRLSLLRKNKSYTQEKLGSLLCVTPQAVSKWEQGNALPDTALLPNLCKILDVSLDYLLIANTEHNYISPYDSVYKNDKYYWGLTPSFLAQQIAALCVQRPHNKTTILDIGSGEGRDAFYFAAQGFSVDALEISKYGIDKINKIAQQNNYLLNTIQADMLCYKIIKQYDVIYSCGSLQFLPTDKRSKIFTDYKNATVSGGLNAHLVFVHKPFVQTAPDWQPNEFFYTSGELASYYADWEIISYDEQTIDCNSMNTPHQHVICSIIAKKPNL